MIPKISYQTYLDYYNLLCIAALTAVIVENFAVSGIFGTESTLTSIGSSVGNSSEIGAALSYVNNSTSAVCEVVDAAATLVSSSATPLPWGPGADSCTGDKNNIFDAGLGTEAVNMAGIARQVVTAAAVGVDNNSSSGPVVQCHLAGGVFDNTCDNLYATIDTHFIVAFNIVWLCFHLFILLAVRRGWLYEDWDSVRRNDAADRTQRVVSNA